MHKSFEVVVVGGGPAGSAAAYTLAKAGIEVCLIDKSVFPRDKLCGGLLTSRSKKVFEQVFQADWDRAHEYSTNGVKLFHKKQLLSSVENYSQFYFTRRYHFDDYLLSLAKNAGVDCKEGASITEINIERKTCRLRSGEDIAYRYLIGADGVNSIVAKSIFGSSFNKKTIGFALETELDRSSIETSSHLDFPEVYFGLVQWGYGWVFPKENTLTVGIGGLHSRNAQMKKGFEQFISDRFGDVAVGAIKGHYIPCGDYRRNPGVEDVLLVGDAAGLVEPITGEGIAFAMQSGHLAASAIIDATSGHARPNPYVIYTETFSQISSILNYASVLSHLIFPKVSQRLFVKVLPKTKNLTHMHMDLMADELDYPQYMKKLISRVPRGIVRQIMAKR